MVQNGFFNKIIHQANKPWFNKDTIKVIKWPSLSLISILIKIYGDIGKTSLWGWKAIFFKRRAIREQ
jgi:hypothetical protein